MKKLILIHLLLAFAVSMSYAAKLPSDDFFAPYQSGSGEDYYTDDYSDNSYSNDNSFLGIGVQTEEECEETYGLWHDRITNDSGGCASCAYDVWKSEEEYNNGGCLDSNKWTAYLACKADPNTDCDAITPIGSITPLLFLALGYIGRIALRKRKA